MPAGCDFICQNQNCSQCKSGFALTGPWPMGQIELVISSLTKSLVIKPQNKTFLDHIIEEKNNGRKYARIIYPNIDRIPKVAYCIELWSPKSNGIVYYDIPINGETLEEAIKKASLPINCSKTGGPLLTFSEVTKEGINCPHCGEKLTQSRWFTNED